MVAGEDGITEEELSGWQGDIKRLNREAIQASTGPQYDGIRGEIEQKQNNLSEMRKVRTEDIKALVDKVSAVRELNRNLYHLKERFMSVNEKKALLSRDDDLRVHLQIIEWDVKDL